MAREGGGEVNGERSGREGGGWSNTKRPGRGSGARRACPGLCLCLPSLPPAAVRGRVWPEVALGHGQLLLARRALKRRELSTARARAAAGPGAVCCSSHASRAGHRHTTAWAGGDGRGAAGGAASKRGEHVVACVARALRESHASFAHSHARLHRRGGFINQYLMHLRQQARQMPAACSFISCTPSCGVPQVVSPVACTVTSSHACAVSEAALKNNGSRSAASHHHSSRVTATAIIVPSLFLLHYHQPRPRLCDTSLSNSRPCPTASDPLRFPSTASIPPPSKRPRLHAHERVSHSLRSSCRPPPACLSPS